MTDIRARERFMAALFLFDKKFFDDQHSQTKRRNA
jgi:hypothetical protein